MNPEPNEAEREKAREIANDGIPSARKIAQALAEARASGHAAGFAEAKEAALLAIWRAAQKAPNVIAEASVGVARTLVMSLEPRGATTTAEPTETAREEPSDDFIERLWEQGKRGFFTKDRDLAAARHCFNAGRAFERRAALVAKDDPDKPGDYLRVREFSDGVKRPPWHEVIREDDIRCKSWKSSGYNYKDRWYGPFVIPEGEAGKP